MGVQRQENIIIQIQRQFTLRVLSLACLIACNPSAYALGFGEASLRSNLGEVLRVQVPLTGATEDVLVPSCIVAKIQTLDGELLDVPRIDIVMSKRTRGLATITFQSIKAISEPVVNLSVAMGCGSSVHRDYSLLLDFAEFSAAAPLPKMADADQDTQVFQPEVPKRFERTNPARKPPVLTPVAIAAAQSAPTEPVKKGSVFSSFRNASKGSKAAKGKDVLHVANDESGTDIELKMSQSLSVSAVPESDQQRDQQRVEENRLAQARFAAIMRGEDPSLATQNELQKVQQKNSNLLAELNRLKQQNLLKDQADKNSSPLLIGLIVAVVALLSALAGLIGLAIRRAKKTEDKSWWDGSSEQKKNVVDIVDYLQNSAEQGNLDPAPITVARDVPVNEPQVKPEPEQSVIPKVEPAPKFQRMGLPALEDTNSSTFNFFGNRGQSIQIEEISDITQEAEFWMSVNDPHRAIEILEPQSRDENPATPVTWLYLLDLYRLVGDEDNYRDLRARFKLKFNAKIPNFHEEVVEGSLRNFEDFPHLVTNCCALWKTDEIVGYLESLLVDDREGERVGFDLPVYRDILFLLSICSELKRVQYQSMANKDDIKLTSKAAAVLQPLENHLIVKPDQPDAEEFGDTLNFDLLDLKPDNKDKS